MVDGSNRDILILGGLSGLSSCHLLSNAGFTVNVFERDTTVGGLTKTVEKNGFRFDLGGHRFFTTDNKIKAFVRALTGSELISVQHNSEIYLRNKYFDYPLKPLNAMFGFGLMTTAGILADYIQGKIKRTIWKKETVSLEDWLVTK